MPFTFTVTDASNFLNYKPYVIRKFVKEGRLKAFRHKPTATLRFRKEDLIDFMKESNSKYHPKLKGAAKKVTEEARARNLKKRAKTAL